MTCGLINKVIRLPIARCFAIICFFFVLDSSFALGALSGVSNAVPATDYAAFWAGSRLLINGGNPYSPVEVFELQRSVGISASKPLLMWSPPWTLSFVLPFGAMDVLFSQFSWLLLHVFLILVSARKLWVIYGQSERNSYLPWIVTLTFIPVWFVLILGQISPLILLGIVGFLHFEKKKSCFLAGVSTTLIAVKPHLVYLFWIGLILWTWNQRRW